jgi:hypothetical protein
MAAAIHDGSDKYSRIVLEDLLELRSDLLERLSIRNRCGKAGHSRVDNT